MSRWTSADYDRVVAKRLARHADDKQSPEVSFDISLQREYARQSGAAFGEVVNTKAREYQPEAIIAGRLYPLVLLCKAHGLPEPMPEFQFHPSRGWRADYCWQTQKIIVEIDGGIWTGGRHVRGQGFIEDQRKLNAATLLGYRVLRYTPDRLGEAVEDLRELLR
jgi:hypothetical protein